MADSAEAPESLYQIKEKVKRPSEIFSDPGFEDVSHLHMLSKKAHGAALTKTKF